MLLSSYVWVVALAFAVLSPLFVRVLGDALEAKVRRRTEAIVARALGAEAARRASKEGQDPEGG